MPVTYSNESPDYRSKRQAMAPPKKLTALARTRGRHNLRLYSVQNTSYQADYHGETAEGSQLPMINIFEKQGAALHYFWASEAFFAPR